MKKIIVFESVHFTIKADKLMKNNGFEYQIITTPREISLDCGMSIETDENNFEQIYKYLEEKGIKMKVFDL